MFCTTCFMFGPHCQHDVVEFDKLVSIPQGVEILIRLDVPISVNEEK